MRTLRQQRQRRHRHGVGVREFLLAEQRLGGCQTRLGLTPAAGPQHRPTAHCSAGDDQNGEGGRDQRFRREARRRRGGHHCNFAADLAQLVEHRAGVRVTLRAVFRQRLPDDGLELRRDVGAHLAQRSGRPGQDRRDDVVGRGTLERLAAGEHLVEHDAEGEHVRRRGDFGADQLLRSHVADRAHGHARAGAHERGCIFAPVLAELGQAEIENLRVAVRRDDHVLRLDVAVDDAGLVRGGQGRGDLCADFDDVGDRHRAAANALAERLAIDHLHGDEAKVVMRADLVDVSDVRVMERRGRLRLLDEAVRELARVRATVVEDLDGHVALELVVARPVDLPHPASA